MFAFVFLVGMLILIMAGLLILIIGAPVLIPLFFLLVMIAPLIVLIYAGRMFSLSPLAMALLPPGRTRSSARVLVSWLVILAAAGLMSWGVGAVSMVGLSATPLTGLLVHPPPGTANMIGAIVYDTLTVSLFLALGLIEVGLFMWAIITFVSSLFGWNRMSVYEKKRFGFYHRSEYVDDFHAWFLADVGSVLPIIGIGIAVFFPMVIGVALPNLYVAWHMGGWSPLTHLPGLVTQIKHIPIPRTWDNLPNLFPLHNWAVLISAIPPVLRDMLIGLLGLAGVNLLVMMGGPSKRPLGREDRQAMAEYQRVMREVHDEHGDVIQPSGEELRYAKALEDYWTHKRAFYPKPEDFGLTAEIIEERVAWRADMSRRAREKRREVIGTHQ